MLTSPSTPSIEVFLLGRIDYQRCLDLQDRLVRQTVERGDGQITLLVCEHPEVITVGRGGSPAMVASGSYLVRSRQIEVRYVKRGGGCLLHSPGQLAIYPIVPLRWHGLSVGQYLERLQSSLVRTLAEFRVQVHTLPSRFGAWGRTGQLAAMGVAVRDWVTWHGAFLNVCPALGLYRLVETPTSAGPRMSSLVAERCESVRMPAVRAALVRHFCESLGCERYHLYTGHPWLRKGTELQIQRET